MIAKPITEDDLHAFVDGRLDDTRAAEIARYLEAHPETAARIESYGAHRLQLQAALDPVAAEVIPNRLSLAHMIEARRQSRPAVWRMAAAAVVLLIAGGSGGWILHGLTLPPSEGILTLSREASNSYSTYASDTVRPVELRADDTAKLVDWTMERIGRKPILPDLSKSGYRLMGGRIVSTPHGPGLMLMYDNDHGTRLVMLTRPMAVDQNKPMVAYSEGNVGGWSWARDGMGFSLVGALSADSLHPLADDIRRQTDDNASAKPVSS